MVYMHILKTHYPDVHNLLYAITPCAVLYAVGVAHSPLI